MSNIFFISDSHFGHKNCLGFTRNDGSLMRPGFDDVDHMDNHMVEQWNSVVGPNDKVYHLGDVAMGKRGLENLWKCNGIKVLIKGNHDKESLTEYQKYFKDVRGSHQMDGILMTHIPVHPCSLSRWPVNVHGHLHHNEVMKYGHNGIQLAEVDPRYICVSVEHIDYTPIALEDLRKLVEKRQK